MATILSETKSTTGSPYAYYKVDATVNNSKRTATTANITIKVTSHLAESSSSLGSGSTYGLVAHISFNGVEKTITLKSTDASWSGTGTHTASGTWNISCEAGSTSITNIKFWVLRTGSAADNSSKGAQILSSKKKSCNNITGIDTYYTAPKWVTSPSIISINETGIILNAGVTDQKCDFYYRIDDEQAVKINDSPVTSINNIVRTDLIANTEHYLRIIIRNPNQSSLATYYDSTFSTYPYPSITNYPSRVTLPTSMSDTLTFTYTFYNPLNRSITVTQSITSDDGNSVNPKNVATNSTSCSLSWNVDDLYRYTKNSSNKTINVSIQYPDRTDNSHSITLTIPELKPIIDTSKFNYQSINNQKLTDLHYSNTNTLVQNNSSMNIWQTSGLATGQGYANISSAIFNFDGTNQNLTTTSTSFKSGSTFNYSTNQNATITVTDSRGFSNRVTVPIKFIGCLNPTATVSATREGGYGTNVTITVGGTYSIIGDNNITKYYLVQKWSNNSWVTDTDLTSDWTIIINPVIITVNSDDRRKILAKTKDSFEHFSNEVSTIVEIGQPTMFIDTNLEGVGVNCFPVNKGIHVQGDALALTGSITYPGLPQHAADTTKIWKDSISFRGAGDDGGWIRILEPTQNDGCLEIATGDDGTEPIYIRQYAYGNINKEITLLDGNGNTYFPGTVNATTVNAQTATVITSSGSPYVEAKRSDTENYVDLMVGSGGVNRGLYVNSLGWILYADSSSVNMPNSLKMVAGKSIEFYNGSTKYASISSPSEWKDLYLDSGGGYVYIRNNGSTIASFRNDGKVYDGNGTKYALLTDFITETKEAYTGELASGDNETLAIDISKANYTPIGLVGYYCSGSRSSYINVYGQYLDGSYAKLIIKNTHSSNPLVADDTKIKVYVLYRISS